jgi:hypothetical protein
MNGIAIDQKTLAELLQLGGQYMLPIAALLRALYSGMRGKLPEGFSQIVVAALVAGVTAGVNGQQPDVGLILKDVLSNTLFTAGLSSFIVIYLLRMTNYGLVVDAIIGAIIGGVIWGFTVYVLGQPWPWWMLVLLVPACAVGFILLRFALRQIVRVVRVAMFFLIIGVLIVLAAGGIMLFQTLTQTVKI